LKALVLAGGRGTRLRPITHTRAKQLVPVANKPVLYYGLEAIAAAGIREVGIIVSDPRELLQPDHRTGELVTTLVNSQAEIRAAVGDGSAFGLKVTYIEQEAPLGLAHAVKISEDFMAGDSFVMYLGDNLIKDGITPFVREFEKEKPEAQILLAKVARPWEFGVAELAGERVVRLKEKPKQPHDVEGWARLGRSYMVLNQPAKAREAYARAVKLRPDDAQLKAAYAEAVAAAK